MRIEKNRAAEEYAIYMSREEFDSVQDAIRQRILSIGEMHGVKTPFMDKIIPQALEKLSPDADREETEKAWKALTDFYMLHL